MDETGPPPSPPPPTDPRPTPPPAAAAPFSAPPPTFPRWLVVVLAAVTVLTLVSFGAWNVVSAWNRAADRLAAEDDQFRKARPLPGGSADPSAEPAAPAGPRAATYPVRELDDLSRVCDGWYYPQSPKFAGKAPHQIAVGVVDSTVLPSRHVMSAVTVPDLKESIWRAWMPEKPGKTQLVACVDLTRSGATLKSCKYDDPKPETVAMKQGFFRLRLYEAATGKKLLERKLTGEDEKCPSVVFLAGGESLYSEVDDRQLYELLRGFVMKK